MKKVFIITAFAGLMACNHEPEVHIMETQHDSGVKFVSDSVFLSNKYYIDSLINNH